MNNLRKTKSILVTGGSGFIGYHLCDALSKLNYKVQVVDTSKPKWHVEGIKFILGDIRDKNLMADVISNCNIIFHLAGTVSITSCQENPLKSYENNLLATINLLEMIKNFQIMYRTSISFLFTSTAAIYGNSKLEVPISELSPSECLSFYAAQKYSTEQVIKLYHLSYGIPSVIFRLFNVFGPGQDPSSPYSGVITLFTKYALEGRPIPLFGGGNQTRDFISVYDVVQAMIKVIDLPNLYWNAKIINIGSGTSIKIRELAKHICKILQSKSIIVNAEERIGDVQNSKADITLARKLLNFSPKIDLEAQLKRFLLNSNK